MFLKVKLSRNSNSLIRVIVVALIRGGRRIELLKNGGKARAKAQPSGKPEGCTGGRGEAHSLPQTNSLISKYQREGVKRNKKENKLTDPPPNFLAR